MTNEGRCELIIDYDPAKDRPLDYRILCELYGFETLTPKRLEMWVREGRIKVRKRGSIYTISMAEVERLMDLEDSAI